MKLIQNLTILPDNSLATWLSREHSPSSLQLLLGPCELSFHPFKISVWAKHDHVFFPKPSADLKFTLRLVLIDDEEKKALLHLKSKNRVLLMLSEMLIGLNECALEVNFILESIEPEPQKEALQFTFRVPATVDAKAIAGGALCLKAAIDSLLFCRGLAISLSSLESNREDESIKTLRAIFLAQL